jgi:PAS domain S-box-containing protein
MMASASTIDLLFPSPARRAIRAGTILHVEDRPAPRLVRNHVLRSAGFHVIDADGVADGWAAVLRDRPDVVLTDVSLGDGDAYELTRRIRSHAALRPLRVVQISARFTDAESRVRGLESGADAYIIEPADPAELVAVMRSMVRSRRTEELFGTLLDGSPMLVAGADEHGRIAVFNAACEALTGYARADVIGQPFVETLVAPGEREIVQRRFQAASAAELAAPHENRWRTVAGETVDIEWRCFSVGAPDGSVWTLGIGQDITDRKRAEAQTRLLESRLHAILDNTTAVIYMVDRASRFLLVNRHFAELFGVTRNEVTGRPITDCFDPEVAAQFTTNNMRTLEARTTCEFEERVAQADGVHTYISVKTPLFDDAGVPYAVCGVSTDITERKKMADELQAAYRDKDSFIATVAHELKQPLAALQTAVVLLRQPLPPERLDRARDVAERQTAHVSRLVDDLLDASRIIQGKVVLHPQRGPLAAIIDAAVSVVQPIADERQLQLQVSSPPDPVWIDADAARLQQVFSNLLTNAAKFTDPGGRIAVIVESDAARATVRVRDTGRGIDPAALPHIFDLFAQAASDGGGLGIGLAVVRGLVERHGGTVEAHSGGLGQGSEFVVRLPLAPAAA